MRKILLIAFAAVLIVAASFGFAQAPANVPFNVHKLTPTVYWVEGGGGNSGVIVGDHSVIVIDAKTTPEGGKELLADIAQITSKPVTTVIETHSDSDHVGGLLSFPKGITIIAHENDLKEQQAALASGDKRALPADLLPNKVLSKTQSVFDIDGVRLELYHWAPAHTSGDLVVYLPAQKIVFTGDILAMQMPDPLIHLEKHGSSEGWIKTAQGMLALDSNEYVPGHGDVQTKKEVEERLSHAKAKRSKIAELVKQGKTLDQIKVAVGDPPPSSAPGGRPMFATYTDVVYKELTQPAQ